jgi:hypothetical protein
VSERVAAKVLGVSRTRTLARAIAAGAVRTVEVPGERGARRMIPKSEVLRISEEGLPPVPVRARPARRPRRARARVEDAVRAVLLHPVD